MKLSIDFEDCAATIIAQYQTTGILSEDQMKIVKRYCYSEEFRSMISEAVEVASSITEANQLITERAAMRIHELTDPNPGTEEELNQILRAAKIKTNGR